MTKSEYSEIESYMLSAVKDSAHDKHHIYRVLNSAVDISKSENSVDFDVLVTACLLHDIGREKEFAAPTVCHAEIGAEMAYNFLLALNWTGEKALHVKECIITHRYRGNKPPKTIEAKILFDADKIDAAGVLGIARTLIAGGLKAEALYLMNDDGEIITAANTKRPSFFHEYNFKLKNIYDYFYTKRAKEIVGSRQKAAINFYNDLYKEITSNYDNGIKKYLL